MSSLPPPTDAGQPISADDSNRLIRELHSRTLLAGGAGQVQTRGGGTVVTKRAQGLQPAARRNFGTRFPFRVYQSSASKVKVVFGQVNSITPTIGGTALDAGTAPELTISVDGVIYLDVTVDGSGAPTAVTVNNAATIPANNSTHGRITLATVTDSSGILTLNQSVTQSLQIAKCGVSTYYFGGV